MTLVRFSNRMPRRARLFDHFFDNDLIDWSNRNFSETDTTLPAVNVKEKENGFEIEMSAPGLKKEDFNVELTNSVLTISCEKKEEDETKDENEKYTDTVDYEKIDAKYEDGILKLSVPKKEEVIPSSKRIEIS